MRTILFLLQKEFIQIFRNKTMLPIIFIMPVVQMVILVFAANLEMKNIKMRIVDYDNTTTSQAIISKFNASPFYSIIGSSYSVNEAQNSLIDNTADLVMVIPANLEKDIIKGQSPKVQLLIDAINGMTAGLVNSYTSIILLDINKDIALELMKFSKNQSIKQITIKQRFWYNPSLNHKHYMVPGIIVLLVTMIGMFLSALNIVSEKEFGTIEQINVTPIKKYQFIIGKLIPFLIIGLFDLALGLFIGKLLFSIPVEGSIVLLFAFAFIYLILVLGLGLLLSIISNTQQQVMFLIFFISLVFTLMSGLFTPIETMPVWAQNINIINPYAYFMKVNRMILLKGSGFSDLIREFSYISIYAIISISIAIKLYKKTT